MKNIIFLVIGIILFTLGGYQNTIYEEKSLIVKATVTDIKTKEDYDSGYSHTYYGSYTVDGKTYKNKKLTTYYTNSSFPEDLFVGDTYKIRVYPDNPEKEVAEGGIFITVGVILIVYNSVVLYKRRKRNKAANPPINAPVYPPYPPVNQPINPNAYQNTYPNAYPNTYQNNYPNAYTNPNVNTNQPPKE